MVVILSEQKGYALILPILTLCCPLIAFYRLPHTCRCSLCSLQDTKEAVYFLRRSKKYLKNLFLGVDFRQREIITVSMIIEEIRKRIKASGKSLNQLGRETGIDKAALSRIMRGGSCKVETADILLKHFGFAMKGDLKMRRHKYRNGQPTSTFEELDFAEQTKSISATISVLTRMIRSNIRRANQEGRDSTEIRIKRLDQLQRMIDRMRD